MKYTNHFSTRSTPQSEPIPGTNQIEDSAGGYAWKTTEWTQLDRFLILGSEGGTYYVSEHKLTVDNARSVLACIQADGVRVVKRVVDVSEAALAPKNDPALFVLAMCASADDDTTRKAALDALPRVARIPTHLFHFLEYSKAFRGWGRGFRNAVATWYNNKEPEQLAYYVTKYRQRDGWTHRDALRLSHPLVEKGCLHQRLYSWVTHGEFEEVHPESTGSYRAVNDLIRAFEAAQSTDSKADLISLICVHDLTREMIPTKWLSDPDVWGALLQHMPIIAMVRNLGNMSKVGLLTTGNWDAMNLVVSHLSDEERLHKSRIHPLQILAAINTYSSGKGFRGSGTWSPIPQIVDALDAAFYTTFRNVEPTNKRLVLALDVSGSMGWGNIAGVGGITPRVGSAAMALITANVELHHTFVGFSSTLIPLNISPRQRLDDVCKYLSAIPMGGTDCALPMLHATKENYYVDTFVVYTDNETWAGAIHPSQALQEYRRKVNPNARLVVVGMVANEFSIADPADSGMLDVVGFSTATPQVISEFAKGNM